MQYRVWAEMFVGGTYSSLHDPPSSQMFIRYGTGGATSKQKSSDVIQAIEKISSALSPKPAADVQSPVRGTIITVQGEYRKSIQVLSAAGGIDEPKGFWYVYSQRKSITQKERQ